MNGKLVVKTGLITAAVIAALAYFSYNASYNPDFSALDFITSASPKKKAKNRKDVQETVYSIQDFALNEPLDSFDEILTRSESHNHVKSLKLWERICLEEGVPGIMKERRSRARGAGKNRPRKLDTSTEEDLIAENQRLRMEIAY